MTKKNIHLETDPESFRRFLIYLETVNAMWEMQPEGIDFLMWGVVVELIEAMKLQLCRSDLEALNDSVAMFRRVLERSPAEINLMQGAGESLREEIEKEINQ
jgi:hypothetical protein